MAADNDKQLVTQNGGSDEGEGGEVAGKKKLSGKQLVLFIILPAVLLLGGGGAAAYFLVFKKPAATAELGPDGKPKAEKKKEKKEAKKGEKKKEGEDAVQLSEGPNGEGFLTLPNIVVNVSTAGARPAFLKLKLTLQTKDMETAEAIEPMLPRIMDQYNGFLRELRMEDLAGSAGYARLQLELLKRVNLAVAPAQVEAVLIEEMLVN